MCTQKQQRQYPVIVVGGGQAGLATSYCLQEKGIAHVVFEKARIAEAWRSERWDTFCLVTPNWQCRLPGFSYADFEAEDDPEGFMSKERIVEFIEAYAASFDPPVREGVAVHEVTKSADGDGFELSTSDGLYRADQVVAATGTYHRPRIPPMAEALPEDVRQLHSSAYETPEALPDGDVLVVGSGQSGAQIAEDLHWAGRQVHLAVGSAPRAPRRYRGRDVVAWLEDLGYYDLPVYEHPQGEDVRHKTNHYLTGRDGGHTIDLRQFALEGMQLYGRLDGIESGPDGDVLHFQPNLEEHLDAADASAASIKERIDEYIAEEDLDAPSEPPYTPPWAPAEERLRQDLRDAGIRTVLWATGYDYDFGWVNLPVFDENGYPEYHRGVTEVPGLYFVGLAWLYTWGSGRFGGVGRDAKYLADQIEHLRRQGAAAGAQQNGQQAASASHPPAEVEHEP
jgi:putative flavoprotein involved in K+ transport